MPSLAEAFAALLSAEQGHAIAPASLTVDTISPDLVDEIARRAAARLAEQDFRQTILNVAEKMVRDEIDRIKATK